MGIEPLNPEGQLDLLQKENERLIGELSREFPGALEQLMPSWLKLRLDVVTDFVCDELEDLGRSDVGVRLAIKWHEVHNHVLEDLGAQLRKAKLVAK